MDNLRKGVGFWAQKCPKRVFFGGANLKGQFWKSVSLTKHYLRPCNLQWSLISTCLSIFLLFLFVFVSAIVLLQKHKHGTFHKVWVGAQLLVIIWADLPNLAQVIAIVLERSTRFVFQNSAETTSVSGFRDTHTLFASRWTWSRQ